MATGIVLPPEQPEHNELQKKAIIAQLKSEIFSLWSHHIENRYWIGRKLRQLQRLHGKPGSGTFLEDLAELDIPRTTSYRYIAFYQRIRAGFDPTPSRMTRAEKDKLAAKWPVEGPGDDDNNTPEMTADQERIKVVEAIQVASVYVEKAKVRTKAGGYRVKLILTKMARMKFKAAYKKLTEKRASEVMYKAVLREAMLHKAVLHHAAK